MRATAAIILAAGGSSRFGGPKQLAHFDGVPLVRRAVDAAQAAGCAPVVVVAGDRVRDIAAILEAPGAQVVQNPRWQAGLGSSIQCGLAVLPPWQAVILMVCDQPLVTADTLLRLLQAGERAPAQIIASAYGGAVGVPVLFPACHGPLLQAAPEGVGAKAVLTAHPDLVTAVPAPEAAFDVDFPEDLSRLMAAIPA